MKNVSDYISRNERKIDEFIDYVYSFYNVVDGIYPIKGCTKHKINLSTQHYLGQCSEDGDLQTDFACMHFGLAATVNSG